MTREELHNMVASGKGYEKNICQIYAIKNGETVYEDNWRRNKTESAIQVMSVTKGIMALITGIAIDRGYIKSVHQKVLDFFPEYTVKRGEKTIYDVTVEHLLTMTAPYKYRSEPWKKVCQTENWALAALDILGGKSGFPGKFTYKTLGLQILSGIIENAVGRKCIDIANEDLFAPLGIPAHKIHNADSWDNYRSFLMKRKAKDNEWYADPGGTVTAGWGLALSARDLAKIGWMLANGGYYGEKCVLSKEWIEKMTAPILKTGDDPGSYFYGYLWYRPYGNVPVYAAIGTGGNLIYVNEDLNLSIGVTGTFLPGMQNYIGFVESNVIPLIEWQ